MFVDAIAKLLQDYSYFVLLLSLGLLGFSVGLYTPRKRPTHQREDPVNALNKRAAHANYTTRAGDTYIQQVDKSGRGLKGSTIRMSTANEADAEKRSDNVVEVVKQLPRRKAEGLKQSPRPLWLRSLSLGQQQRKESTGGDGGDDGDEEKKGAGGGGGGMQRKASLTGEEVKEMADAFIARVRQRLRLQRQESYEARLDRSS